MLESFLEAIELVGLTFLLMLVTAFIGWFLEGGPQHLLDQYRHKKEIREYEARKKAKGKAIPEDVLQEILREIKNYNKSKE